MHNLALMQQIIWVLDSTLNFQDSRNLTYEERMEIEVVSNWHKLCN